MEVWWKGLRGRIVGLVEGIKRQCDGVKGDVSVNIGLGWSNNFVCVGYRGTYEITE